MWCVQESSAKLGLGIEQALDWLCMAEATKQRKKESERLTADAHAVWKSYADRETAKVARRTASMAKMHVAAVEAGDAATDSTAVTAEPGLAPEEPAVEPAPEPAAAVEETPEPAAESDQAAEAAATEPAEEAEPSAEDEA